MRKPRSVLSASPNALRLLDYLFRQPVLDVRIAEEHLAVTFPTASATMALLVEQGVLRESIGQKRNRLYRFEKLLGVFLEKTPVSPLALEQSIRTES